MRGLSRQIILGAAVVLTLAINGLASTVGLLGRQTGSISDNLPNAFVPAGFTFAIWGVIFLGLIAFALWQGRTDRRGPRLDAVFWPFLLVNLLNVGWLLTWHSLAYGPSVVVMLALLGSLIWLYLTLARLDLRGAEQFWLGAPVSLYLGWITVATAANVTAYLVSAGYPSSFLGLGAPTWSALLVVVAGLVGAWLLWRRRDWVFGAALVWSFWGVYAARPEVAVVVAAILVAAALLAISLFGGLWRLRFT